MISLLYNRFSWPKLNQYELISPGGNSRVYEIKMFQGNKLLCLSSNNILIFDIKSKNLLCKIMNNNNIYLNKAEIIGNDKFIAYGRKYLKFYKYLEDKEKELYNCVEKGELEFNGQNAKINNILNIKKKIIIIGDNIFSIYNSVNNKLELQTKIKAINLSQTNIKTQGFLLNKDIVGIFSYPQQKFEFWNIRTYKFIYITDKVGEYNEIFITEDNNIINLKDDDNIIIGNYMVALKFSFKLRGIVKKYDFSINKFYQINNLIYILQYTDISKFDLGKEKYSGIAASKEKIDSLIVLNEENFISLINNKICLLYFSKSKAKLMDYIKFIFIVMINLFYLKKLSKLKITKTSLICSLAFSPLEFLIYIRELNYVYYILIILGIIYSFSILYDGFKNLLNRLYNKTK